jgi:Transposase DDE domain
MRAAFRLARDALPAYSCKFSRKDFTLPQLFACLAVKEQLGRTYRGAEALLRDCGNWLRDVGLCRAPDHNTLWRAAKFLLARCRVARLLDAVARWAALARALGLSLKPLAIDSTYFEPRHVSRHYERRLREARKDRAARRARAGPRARERSLRAGERRGARLKSRAARRLPKLTLAVAGHCHLVLSAAASTGAGSDCGHFAPVLYDAWRRVPNRRFKVAGDSGFDSEPNHRLARRDMGLQSLIPPGAGRPPKGGGPPGGRWRRRMKRLLATKASRKRCGYTQRWQVETAISMAKRNLGSALRGRTAWSRRRDMALKALTHDLMILAAL